MISSESLAGYLLEDVLGNLLRDSGYRLITDAPVAERDALEKDGATLYVKGRGARHQADALGELKFPIPFSMPVRLFLEAKVRSSPVGLTVVRNAYGTIADINEKFSAVVPGAQPHRRFHYRYSLFSTAGFTGEAQDYALTHQISLIDLTGDLFANLVRLVRATADKLIQQAKRQRLRAFPVAETRYLLRRAMSRGELRGDAEHATANAGVGSWSKRSTEKVDFELFTLMKEVSLDLDGNPFFFAFPSAPFIMVLRPDSVEAFEAFASQSSSNIQVDLAWNATSSGAGEWVARPRGDSGGFSLRFTLPPASEQWLIVSEADGVEEADRAITVFLEDKMVRLSFEPVLRRDLAVDTESVEYSDRPVDAKSTTNLRTHLAQDVPRSAVSRAAQERTPSSRSWTIDSVRLLLDRLKAGNYKQRQLILAAAREGGAISRNKVYELSGYEKNRTLRGLTRPTNRITSEMVHDGVLSAEVPYPFNAQYPDGVKASMFTVPSEIVSIIGSNADWD